jgi:hypothetical protein
MAGGGGGGRGGRGEADERSSRTANSGSAAAKRVAATARVPRGDRLARFATSRPLARNAASRAVQALPGQQAAAVLWAPDALPVDGDTRFPHFPYVPTELVSADPSQPLSDPDSLVHPDDQVRLVHNFLYFP